MVRDATGQALSPTMSRSAAQRPKAHTRRGAADGGELRQSPEQMQAGAGRWHSAALT